MGIHPLIDLCSAKIASFFTDKSEKNVVREFNIDEPLTEEEKSILKEEMDRRKYLFLI